MPTTATPVKSAFARRDQVLQEAQETYSATVKEANRELADIIRKEAEGSSMTQVANDAGVTRQTLHTLTRRFPAKG